MFLRAWRRLATFVSTGVGVWLISSQVTYAQDSSLGGLAQNILGPFSAMGKIMMAVCIVGGVGFILGSVVQYKAHRENPTQVRISTPLLLLILGIALVSLPFLGKYSSSSLFLNQ